MKKLLFAALLIFISANYVSAQVYSMKINNNSACSASINFSRAIDDNHNGCSGSFNFIASNFFPVAAGITGVYFADVSVVNGSTCGPSFSGIGWATGPCALATTVSDWAAVSLNIGAGGTTVYNPNGVGACMSTTNVVTISTGCSTGSGNTKISFSNDLSGNSLIDIVDLP